MNEAKRQADMKLIRRDMDLYKGSDTPVQCPEYECRGEAMKDRACYGCLESRLNALMTPQEIKENNERWL